jgi:hypothetical protein
MNLKRSQKMFSNCLTCQVEDCPDRHKGIGCEFYYNKNINSLESTMMFNENFDKRCDAVPNCPVREVHALEKWFRDCATQWLNGFKAEIEQFPTADELSIECRGAQLDLITELIEMVNKKAKI